MKWQYAVIMAAICISAPAFAANEQKPFVPEQYKMESMETKNDSKLKPAPELNPADYLSPDVALTPTERQALRQASEWEASGPAPIQAAGRVMYVYGASVPTVIGAPLQISTIELQPGEIVNEVVVGDSARWMLDVAKTDSQTLILLKPVDSGLATSAVITTDRRAYHLNLKSQKSGHIARVAFLYPGDNAIRLRDESKESSDSRRKPRDSETAQRDISNLNFDYDIKGKSPWKPLQVYDDGKQMFIKFPSEIKSGDAPILLVKNGGEDTMANFRMKDLSMIIDGVFPEAILISGVGSKQQRVTIRKK
jgi:type IV secretion system protein VirB9